MQVDHEKVAGGDSETRVYTTSCETVDPCDSIERDLTILFFLDLFAII